MEDHKTYKGPENCLYCMVKKNYSGTAQQVNNALKDVGVHVSPSAMKRAFHNLRGHATRCKPLVNLCTTQKGHPTVHKNIRKKQAECWNKVLWTCETKINIDGNSDGSLVA